MEVSVLGRMLKKAKLWAMMADDITKCPERSNVGRALQVDEKSVLFETAGRRPSWTVAHCGAVLAASTTCRGVELKGLKWKDIDLFEKVFWVDQRRDWSPDDSAQRGRDASLGSTSRDGLSRIVVLIDPPQKS